MMVNCEDENFIQQTDAECAKQQAIPKRQIKNKTIDTIVRIAVVYFWPWSQRLAVRSPFCLWLEPRIMACHSCAVVHAWQVQVQLIRRDTTQLIYTCMHRQVSVMANLSHPTLTKHPAFWMFCHISHPTLTAGFFVSLRVLLLGEFQTSIEAFT